MEGRGLIGIHCLHIWNHRNETPLYKKIYVNKNEKKRIIWSKMSIIPRVGKSGLSFHQYKNFRMTLIVLQVLK
jgi:hypothetical protein